MPLSPLAADSYMLRGKQGSGTVARDHRILDPNGNRQDFTCANSQYRTDISKGEPHGTGRARGSVFDSPLVNHGGWSLWLEHVVASGGSETYWLMWYDPKGVPTIPLSGVLDKADIQEMSRQLASFVP
jgi:hypothetical protein